MTHTDDRMTARRARRQARLTTTIADRRPASRPVGVVGQRLTPVTVAVIPAGTDTDMCRFVDDRGNEYTGRVGRNTAAGKVIASGHRRAVLTGRITAHQPLRTRGYVTAVTALALVAFNLETGPAARYLPPASRVEHPEPASSNRITWHPLAPHPWLVPAGLALAADPAILTDAEIDARLRARRLTDPYLSTCRTLWRATREFRVIVGAETGGGKDATTGRPVGSAVLEATAAARGYPDHAAWAALGIGDQAAAFGVFDGFPHDAWRVVAPRP